MAPLPSIPSPTTPLYHIGYWPRPGDWKPWEHRGRERFDDPFGRFRTLYAAENRRACFLETLAPLRPSLSQLSAEAEIQGLEDQAEPDYYVPRTWRLKRGVVQLRVHTDRPFLDLRQPQTAHVIRREFAAVAHSFGVPEVDVAGLRTVIRGFTQPLASWAYDLGYAGLVYRSRHSDDYTCWAIFEGRCEVDVVGEAEPVLKDDPDLLAAAKLYELAVEV